MRYQQWHGYGAYRYLRCYTRILGRCGYRHAEERVWIRNTRVSTSLSLVSGPHSLPLWHWGFWLYRTHTTGFFSFQDVYRSFTQRYSPLARFSKQLGVLFGLLRSSLLPFVRKLAYKLVKITKWREIICIWNTLSTIRSVSLPLRFFTVKPTLPCCAAKPQDAAQDAAVVCGQNPLPR